MRARRRGGGQRVGYQKGILLRVSDGRDRGYVSGCGAAEFSAKLVSLRAIRCDGIRICRADRVFAMGRISAAAWCAGRRCSYMWARMWEMNADQIARACGSWRRSDENCHISGRREACRPPS